MILLELYGGGKNLKISFYIGVTIVLTLLAFPAGAQDDDESDIASEDVLDLFDDDEERTKKGWLRFYAAAGAAYLDADGSLSLNAPNGDSITVVDFERAGLQESDSTYWLSLNWRSANSKWGVWFSSWQYDVIGSKIWTDSVDIPGVGAIPVGAEVSSEFDADWYILEATYSFFRTDRVDAGIGFGFHAVDLDTTIKVNVQVGDQEVNIISERLDVLAPLPNFLAYVHWKISPHMNLVSRLGYFSLNYDKYSGAMVNAHAILNYEFSPRWAIGVGYQFVDLDLVVEKSDFDHDYDMSFSGPMAFIRIHF
jgi:hypothetical protein